jgi:trigger factor
MSYTSTIEEVNSTRRKFKITVDKSLVAEHIGKALDEVQKTAQIKGFRKGKVPLTLVKKFYLNDVRQKALEKVVDQTYRKAAEDSKLQIVSYPNIESVGTFDDTVNFDYVATVDVNPLVEITGYKGLKLKLEKSKVPDVETQIAQTRKKFLQNAGKIQVAEGRTAVAKDDLLTLDYRILENGTLIPGQERKGARLTLDGSNLAEVEAGLVGAKIGTAKSFEVEFPQTHPDEALKGKKLTFEATVTKIEEIKTPELDEEFVKRFGYTKVEDFDNALRDTVTKSIKKQRLALLKEQLVAKIVELNPFDVPESLVDSTIDRSIDDVNTRRPKNSQFKKDDEAVRSTYREWALNEVRGVLALGHVARIEEVKLDEAAVAQEIASFATQNGMAPQDVFKRFGSQIVEEFRGKVLVDMVVEHLVGLAEIEEV